MPRVRWGAKARRAHPAFKRCNCCAKSLLVDAYVILDSLPALEPDQPQAIAMKSAILWHQNRLTEAEPFIAKLAAMNPSDSGIWINLAYIRRRTQSLDHPILLTVPETHYLKCLILQVCG